MEDISLQVFRDSEGSVEDLIQAVRDVGKLKTRCSAGSGIDWQQQHGQVRTIQRFCAGADPKWSASRHNRYCKGATTVQMSA